MEASRRRKREERLARTVMMLWSKSLLILAISLKVTIIAEEVEEKIEKGNSDQILDKMSSSEIDTAENQEEKAYPSRKQYQPPPRPPPHSGFGPLLTHHESPSIPVPLPLPSLQGSLIFPALPQKVQKGRPGGYAVDHLSPKDQLGGYGSPQPIYTSRLGSKNNNFPGFPNLPGSDTWPLPQPEMPVIIHLDVKCEKNLMKVAVEFDKAFHGIIFSKGHYNYGNCVHLPAGSGRKSVYFDISINSCGTTGNTENGLYGYGGNSGSGTFFENTIIVQYDPQVQEVWDQARKLRCTWHDQYEKAVTFRPFPVDMLDVVRADFAGDNVGCWMQIQVGKGPWASEAAGIVKIGQTMTMVLAIKDDENRFDMLVRNCIAHDGKRAPIELVDGRGCIVRSKLMSRFTKIKNFGSSASVLSYAHFQAFKFPDSMEVHFQCTIQICRYQCPEQCVYPVDHTAAAREGIQDPHPGYVPAGRPREERDVSFSDNSKGAPGSSLEEMTEIGLNRVIRVVSVGDLAFSLKTNDSTPVLDTYDIEDGGVICMSTPGFVASLVVLLAILVVTSLFSAFLCLKQRSPDGAASTLSYDLPVLKKNKY